MFATLSRKFQSLMKNQKHKRNQALKNATAPLFEMLEDRRLLSTVTFTTDATSVNSAAASIYLTPNNTTKNVDVRYGSSTGTVVHTFTGTGDTDQIVSPSSNVTFYQRVFSAKAPDGGITVSAGGSSTLEIDAGPSDQIIQVTATTSISGTVQVTDTTNLDPATDVSANNAYGSGITHLTIRTNNNVSSTIPTPGGTQLSTDGTYVSVPNLAAATSLVIETGSSTYDLISVGGGENSNVTNAAIHTGAGHDQVILTSFDGTDTDGVSSANIDFGTGSAVGNQLTVGSGGTVHLTQSGGSPHMVVDTISVEGGGVSRTPGTLIVDVPTTTNSLTIGSGGSAEFATTSGTSAVGTLTADAATVVVDTSSIVNIADTSAVLTFTVNGHVKMTSTSVGSVLTVTTLTIGSSGLLDVGKSFLYVDNTATPFSLIHSYIDSGYHINPSTGFGDYNGATGITSFDAKANADHVSVGYYDGALQNPSNMNYIGQLLGPDSDSGAGTGMPQNQILIRPTLTGDLNGDGTVNSYDTNLFNSFGFFSQTTSLGYQAGDLNGDGVVDSKDVAIFNSAGNFGNGVYS